MNEITESQVPCLNISEYIHKEYDIVHLKQKKLSKIFTEFQQHFDIGTLSL